MKATASGIVAGGQQSVIRLVTPVWYMVEASRKSCAAVGSIRWGQLAPAEGPVPTDLVG